MGHVIFFFDFFFPQPFKQLNLKPFLAHRLYKNRTSHLFPDFCSNTLSYQTYFSIVKHLNVPSLFAAYNGRDIWLFLCVENY